MSNYIEQPSQPQIDLDDVAEWVGLHYGRNFEREPENKRKEWVERYAEAHELPLAPTPRDVNSNREIISKGRCQTVTDAEIKELRAANVSWYVYCQKRLTANHADALSAMLKHAKK